MVRRALGLLLLTACFPPPLDETGRRCDRDRPCGDGFVCFDGVCSRPEEIDAGPDNWLPNASFEQINDAGDPLFWRPLPASSGGDITTDSTYVKDGMRSVRLFSRDGGEQPGVQQTFAAEIRNTTRGQVWCARAWVRSSSPDGGLAARLWIRERPADGGAVIGENTPGVVRVDTSWRLLEESYFAEGADRLDVRVTSNNRVRRQDQFWVDDVRLKRSVTQQCTW